MDFYKCKVRLGGNVQNEVWLSRASAPEIIVLRHLHGNDAVVSISKVDSHPVEHAHERDRLTHAYVVGLATAKLNLRQIFGPEHQPLPISIDARELVEDTSGIERGTGERRLHTAPAGVDGVPPPVEDAAALVQ